RSQALPDLVTTVEAGVPNSDYNFWVGMAAPSKTPREIVNRMHQATMKALEDKEVRASMAKLGPEPMPLGLDEFAPDISKEVKTNAALVRRRGSRRSKSRHSADLRESESSNLSRVRCLRGRSACTAAPPLPVCGERLLPRQPPSPTVRPLARYFVSSALRT